MPILPLPDDVVARIKSSTAIVSLSDVVLELIKNSLDANATAVDVTVDFARGSCTVDDNGGGIPPQEFAQDGRLAKLYCTSKYYSEHAQFGRHGTFLASLAALSLLTIASRHADYRSQQTVTFHHGKILEHQLPTISSTSSRPTQGTHVTVRNLFGNLPVRVKQRAITTEHKSLHDRLWASLKRDATGLLLCGGNSVSLKVRDSRNQLVFSFNTQGSSPETGQPLPIPSRTRGSSWINRTLSILTQANCISVNEWPSWVPVSAATTTVSVKGAISLTPAPSKNIQFISVGMLPLSADNRFNELYNEVNILFASSGFGTEDGSSRADVENQPAKIRKSVDRYPMFYFQITPTHDLASKGCDHFIRDQGSLQVVSEVLAAMVTQWLTVHHFRPPAGKRSSRRAKSVEPPPKKTHTRSESVSDSSTPMTSQSTSSQRVRSFDEDQTSSLMAKKRDTGSKKDSKLATTRRQAFADWSRIKSGKAGFHHEVSAASKAVRKMHLKPSLAEDMADLAPIESCFLAQTPPDSTSSAGKDDHPHDSQLLQPSHSTDDDNQDDQTVLWFDTSTGKTGALNSRTGCCMLRAPSENNLDTNSASLSLARKATRPTIHNRPASLQNAKPQWLQDVLEDWDNPIFQSCEQSIEHFETEVSYRCHNGRQSPPSYSQATEDGRGGRCSSFVTGHKLSRNDLHDAEVISQVDRKFILVKVNGYHENSGQNDPPSLLVLIDQHAADERIQVEKLLEELCRPIEATQSQSSESSRLDHRAHVASIALEVPRNFEISQQESSLFTIHASRFAAWGILFDLTHSASAIPTKAAQGEQHVLKVTHLPPAISARCSSDPELLMSFLRSAVWSYSHATIPTSSNTSSSDWVVKIANCPPGLVDLVNSRACRSAIMFNDELDTEQCRAIVRNLANCRFPFLCAHGRPSMVPLLDVEASQWCSNLTSRLKVQSEGFVQAWSHWKRTTG